MEVIHQSTTIYNIIASHKKEGKTVGYVPTMGFLHEGHLALVEQARSQSDIVVMSIFVNPTQFGPNEDFETYPRDFEKDMELAKTHGVDYLFYPDVKEIYPNGIGYSVIVKERVNQLCGASRPGHFDGVATVLTKFFNIISPHYVFLGMKDAQQVAVVDGLVKSFHFPLKLIPVETVRESDGLAKSSRNIKLTEEERNQAPQLYQGLQKGLLLINNGDTDPLKVKKIILDYIKENAPLGEVDYVEVLSYPGLKEISVIDGKVILALAVKFKQARLIDNIVITIS